VLAVKQVLILVLCANSCAQQQRQDRPGSGVEPPRLLREVKATYTEEARRHGITGDVLMEVVVRRDGSVGDAHVLQGLGYGLEERAISAVKQWRFAPAMRKGVPVDVLVEVAVEFTLR